MKCLMDLRLASMEAGQGMFSECLTALCPKWGLRSDELYASILVDTTHMHTA